MKPTDWLLFLWLLFQVEILAKQLWFECCPLVLNSTQPVLWAVKGCLQHVGISPFHDALHFIQHTGLYNATKSKKYYHLVVYQNGSLLLPAQGCIQEHKANIKCNMFTFLGDGCCAGWLLGHC